MELMFISLIVFIVFFSLQFNDICGQIFIIIILSIIAVESSISLAILVTYYKLTASTNMDFLLLLKG